MAKRRRKVTGVRRTDEFSNFLVMRVETAPTLTGNTFITTRVQTPLPRIRTSGNRATIMELLWVECQIPTLVLNFEEDKLRVIRVVLSIGAPPLSIPAFNNPLTFAEFDYEAMFIEGIGQLQFFSYFTLPQPRRYDFTTREGDGYLLTAEAFNLTLQTTQVNPEFATIALLRLHYRFVDIPLDEFVGLVQSTQQQ